MKGFASSLLRSASVYWIGNLLQSALGFLLMPVMTRYLTETEIGTFAMFVLLVTVLDPLLGLNMSAAIARKFFDTEKTDTASYVSTCLTLLVPTTAAALVLGWLLGKPLGRALELPPAWILIAIGVACSNVFSNVALVLLQVQVRPWAYTAFQVLRTLTNLAVPLYLVVVSNLGWQGRAAGVAVTSLVSAIVAIVVLHASGFLTRRWDRAHLRHALGYGVPLIPYSLGGVSIAVTDRIFVTQMVGLSSTGLYSVGYSIGQLMGLVEDACNKAWQPWLFEHLKTADDSTKRRIVRLSYVYKLGLAVAAIGLALVAPPFLSVFVGPRFKGSSEFVFWIALAYAFNGMCKVVGNYVFYSEKTRVLAWVTLATAAINVPLNYYLIRWHGALGAAQATTAVFFLSYLLTWIVSAQVHPMPWIRALRPEKRA